MYLLILIIFIILIINYSKIPSYRNHIHRNKYNVPPVGNLKHIQNNKYIDENGIIWMKRGFFTSLLHNPFKNYVFETRGNISSSEVQIVKKDFDQNLQNFKFASFNYYSSFDSKVSHFFADVLPIIIYGKNV